jgi:hypothetical protein
MSSGFQIVLLIFVLVMVYFTYLHFKRQEIGNLASLIWFSIWSGAILIVLFPRFFTQIGASIAIARTFDLAVLVGFMIVVPAIFVLNLKLTKIEKALEQLIRAESFKSAHSQVKKKSRPRKNGKK